MQPILLIRGGFGIFCLGLLLCSGCGVEIERQLQFHGYEERSTMSTNQPLDESIRKWGMACHLSALGSIVVSGILPIPFLGVLIPYIVWKTGRDRHPFVDDQGRESVNFQISMSIYLISAFIVWFILLFTTCAVAWPNSDGVSAAFTWAWIGGIAFLALFSLFQLCVIIFASVKALQGESYRYPFTLRFLQ